MYLRELTGKPVDNLTTAQVEDLMTLPISETVSFGCCCHDWKLPSLFSSGQDAMNRHNQAVDKAITDFEKSVLGVSAGNQLEYRKKLMVRFL